jgi:hypothetical protein
VMCLSLRFFNLAENFHDFGHRVVALGRQFVD